CEGLVSSIEHIFETRIKVSRRPSDVEFLEDAWDRASSRVFPLLNGDNILIEETSACTTVDINAGSDQSFTNVNREVMRILPKILYQGRFGGKVVVDMLPISNREESERLVRQFESEWSDLDISAQLFGVSKIGLLEFILPRRGYPLGWIEKIS
ncbi:MAG: ribonuclease E/G, partial [Alphaproteobacteria bacterium]|nr:ribonuclease E/G [Alphaproteobacteria bacterium]